MSLFDLTIVSFPLLYVTQIFFQPAALSILSVTPLV